MARFMPPFIPQERYPSEIANQWISNNISFPDPFLYALNTPTPSPISSDDEDLTEEDREDIEAMIRHPSYRRTALDARQSRENEIRENQANETNPWYFNLNISTLGLTAPSSGLIIRENTFPFWHRQTRRAIYI